jgi:hypothetical protein
MPNYIKLIGDYYPTANAFVEGDLDPNVYDNISWVTTPIAKATLDALTEKEELQIFEEHDTFANMPAAGVNGRLFLATDTLEYYRDNGASWELLESPLSGDVTRTRGTSILTLKTVNSNVGTFGGATTIPVITVNSKGLVTGVTTAAVSGGGGGSSIFGSEFYEASNEASSTTTSTTYVQKLRLTTGTLPDGKYRIGWYAELNQSSTTSRARLRVQVNDTFTACDSHEEPQDVANWMPHSGFVFYSGSGVFNVDMDYSAVGGGTAAIVRARLELWRVS